MKIDLIINNARQLVTCASGKRLKKGGQMKDVGLVENGSIAVHQGKFAGIGTAQEIEKQFSAEKNIDASGKVVCPGFIDCHTHIVFAGNRLDEFELKIKGADYLEILKSGGGIINTVRKTRAASLKSLIEQSLTRLEKMLELGTTTAEIKTGYGLNLESELKMLEAISELDKLHHIDVIPTFLGAHAVPFADFQGKNLNNEEIADVYTNLICEEMLPFIADSRRINQQGKESVYEKPFFVDVFCEQNAFNLAQTVKVLQTAKNLGFSLKAHVDEFTNLGAARAAINLGAVSVDHLDKVSASEIEFLANSETVGVVTPTVNFNFGSAEFADARKFIDSGCAVAVSTDYNPGSAPCPSLPNAMAISCRYQKLLPAEAFNAATINSAFAVGLGEKTGSIETGKQADILILETDDFRQIVYEFGGNFVGTVIKNGEVVLENQRK